MEKKAQAKQKTTALGLQTKALHPLDEPRLQRVIGGARVRIPIGFSDDGTPIYDDTAG